MSAPAPKGPLAAVEAHQVTAGGRAVARAAWLLVNVFSATLRWRVDDPFGVLAGAHARPAIYALWHNRSALAPVVYRRFIRARWPERQLTAMASASKDGAFAARVMELFGTRTVRGSSSRRGPQAMAELIDAARGGSDLAITPDGPRGPRYRVQAGVIALAQYAGLPLVPVSYHLSARKVLRSWDGYQVPLPFGRCEVAFGEPLAVRRRLEETAREELRGELERRLVAITRD
jgi:lysophospholipid acyltransferase (LPLAT)-like uncharacterized protein